MATKKQSTNTGLAEKSGWIPRNPTGIGGFTKNDPRANRTGQRNRKAVARAAQARELCCKVLNEPVGKAPPKVMTRLEMSIRQQVKLAMQGDYRALDSILDRLWGKAAQPLTGADDGPIQTLDLTLKLGNIIGGFMKSTYSSIFLVVGLALSATADAQYVREQVEGSDLIIIGEVVGTTTFALATTRHHVVAGCQRTQLEDPADIGIVSVPHRRSLMSMGGPQSSRI